MQVPQAASDLRRVEDGPFLLKPRAPHVVDVKLEVPPIHECQHQTERVLRLKRVRQTDLRPIREQGLSQTRTPD